MADRDEQQAAGRGATDPLPALPGLQRPEAMALLALNDRIEPPADAASGHILRQDLQRLGLTRLTATLAIQALVGYALVARVRRDEVDGRFYTAYQLTARGKAWLRAHGTVRPRSDDG